MPVQRNVRRLTIDRGKRRLPQEPQTPCPRCGSKKFKAVLSKKLIKCGACRLEVEL